ncbi:MAG: hypothetical protein AAF849_06205 [Bacteroidota bacterium]
MYDGSGVKWRKTVFEDGQIVSKREYYGEIEYESDTLEAVYHQDGRAVAKGNDIGSISTIFKTCSAMKELFFVMMEWEAEIVTTNAYSS